MTISTKRMVAVAAAATALTVLTACSGGDDTSSTDSSTGTSTGGGGTTLTDIAVWDPYPQHDESSDWAKYLQSCAPEGTTVTRTSAATADLLNNLTSAVKEGNAPDVVLLDNPAVPDAAVSGLLASAEDVGMDTAGFDANLAGPGTVDGVTYGVPIGANTLGLYYNADILEASGVDPLTITDWDSLNDALATVTAAGHKGITFSGIAGEEGVFQALPWFWGAGAQLDDLGLDQAVEAGQLLSDWIGQGYAPKSALTDNQSASWDLFLTGEYAFAENGSWFAKAASELTDFSAVAMPLPGHVGGAAPAPTGGEFVLAPLQKKDAEAHYANASKIIDCLVGADNQVKTADALGYFAANKDLRAAQVAADPIWTPWATSIESAQGRTTDLGPGYTAASAALSTALQASLNAAGDADAVRSAFEQAAQG